MTMTPLFLLREIGGLPLVHDTFKPTALATLVACLRAELDGWRNKDISGYLNPTAAASIYRNKARVAPECQGESPLPKLLQNKVNAAIARIRTVHPEWIPIFELQIEWRVWRYGRLSTSNPLIPQHIHFGDEAFLSDEILEETVVHEISHVWCAMIAEIYDFQTHGAPGNLILPSGTGGKDVRGVLLAALFAAAAFNFHKRGKPYAPASIERASLLMRYLKGCITTLSTCGGLSEMGTAITRDLVRFSQSNKP